MKFLNIEEAINGKEGKATAKIGDQIHELFFVRSIEANVIKNKEARRVIGSRAVQNRTLSWTGKGKMVIYYVTKVFRQMMQDYIKTGKDIYFDLTVVNDDPQNSDVIGKHTATLRRVNIDNVLVTKLMDEDALLDEEVTFTFEDVDYIETFKK